MVLDTTLLVYALVEEHTVTATSRALLELMRDGEVRATTTVEVIQEFCHVRTRRRSRADAPGRARAFARGLTPLVRPDETELLQGLQLYRASSALSPSGVLAATALGRGWALASADQAFAAGQGPVAASRKMGAWSAGDQGETIGSCSACAAPSRRTS